MSNQFSNRVYGCAIIKSINSNYNADFSGQPRKLPNGIVYATDKALKYSIRNYWKDALKEKVFYFKSLTEDMSPRTLDQTYELHFGVYKTKDKSMRKIEILKNILSCLDVRLFGGTYAGKTNISIHGTCQITPGVNRFSENITYSEQIMSPFSAPQKSKKEDDESEEIDETSADESNESKSKKGMTTLGLQSRLEEGHYVHHFTVNPQNIADDITRVDMPGLSNNDIEKLKAGLRKGVTYYDSAAKIGTENELLLWIQLKPESQLILPSLVNLVTINDNREIDMKKVQTLLEQSHIASEIEKIELYYNKETTKVINQPKESLFIEL